MQVSFIASDINSLAKAAEKIDMFKPGEKIIFLTNVVEHSLMRAPFPINIVFAFAKKHKGRAGIAHMFHNLNNFGRDYGDKMIADTRKHMLTGVDTEDNNSVGGFSQRELNLLFRGIHEH